MKFFKKIKHKIRSHPSYIAISRQGDKVADCILKVLLGFLNIVGPVWNFFFVKTPDPEDKTNGIS